MRNENNLIWEAYTDQATNNKSTPMSGDEAYSKLRGKAADGHRDHTHPFIGYIDGVVQELSDTHKVFYGEDDEIYVSSWDNLVDNDAAQYSIDQFRNNNDCLDVIWDVSWELFNKNVPYEQAAEIVFSKLGI